MRAPGIRLRSRWRLARSRAEGTRKPMPPASHSSSSGRPTAALPAYGRRPSPRLSKPALQKADTDRNRAFQAACSSPARAGHRARKPASSSSSVPPSSSLSAERGPPSQNPPPRVLLTTSPDSWATALRRLSNTRTAKVMTPRPPSWSSARTTPWPSPLSSWAVETTARPVTQMALAAVNSASSRFSGARPATTACGRPRTIVPTRIAATKPEVTRTGARSQALRRPPSRILMRHH